MDVSLESLFGLGGRVSIVTGGASGLGRAVAVALAAAGSRVVIFDRNREAGEEALELLPGEQGGSFVTVDVTRKTEIDAAVADVVDAEGAVDVLVNSAGTTHTDWASEISEERWNEVIALNLTGTMLCCQAGGRCMIERRRGSIINIASIMALAAIERKVAYNSSKHAVAGLTKSLAVEWGKYGVRVNALAPSPFESPLLAYSRSLNPDLVDAMVGQTALGRLGKPEEIQGPALFLASDASSMVTGHVLAVDGGYLAS
jgi:NAD(P)-dependent dehydrogenase (short-subunit alcohol dehydrogenase family)